VRTRCRKSNCNPRVWDLLAKTVTFVCRTCRFTFSVIDYNDNQSFGVIFVLNVKRRVFVRERYETYISTLDGGVTLHFACGGECDIVPIRVDLYDKKPDIARYINYLNFRHTRG
jgi:hypothetical protein